MDSGTRNTRIGSEINWKSSAMLVLALLVGGAASYGVKSVFFVNKAPILEEKAFGSGVKERLLVAKGVVTAGSVLTAQNTRFVLVDENDAPRDGVVSFNGVSGRVVVRDLRDGETISLYDLESPELSDDSSTGFVPPGYSIVSVEIAAASKENGSRNYLRTTKLDRIVRVGDVVDFSVVKEEADNSDGRVVRKLVTETIATDVEVFSVLDEERFGSDGSERISTLSLLLTNEQLEKTRRAFEQGKLKISFNNSTDVDAELDGSEAYSNRLGAGSRNSENSFATVNEGFVIKALDSDVDADYEEAPVESENEVVDAEPIDESSLISGNDSFEISFPTAEVAPESDVASPQIDEAPVSEPDVAPEVDLSQEAPKWNNVSFADPEAEVANDALDVASDDANWIGERTYRPRPSQEGETASYAVSNPDLPVADSAQPDVEPTQVKAPSDPPKEFKKKSPFVTVPVKKKN